MSERTDALLESLLGVQRELLANQQVALEQGQRLVEQQREALEQQKLSVQRQGEAIRRQRFFGRFIAPVVLLIMIAVLLPYLWSWVRYLMQRA